MSDLESISRRVRDLVQSEAQFGLVSARVVLRTGVSLSRIKPGTSAADVEKVVAVLAEMGIDLGESGRR